MTYTWNLGLCTIFQNEARWLKEYIEFYILIGVEHFYLYNHQSTDNYKEVLKPYIDKGIVQIIDWNRDIGKGQYHFVFCDAFTDGVKRAKGECKWLLVVDTDEFFFTPTQVSLSNYLKNYEDDKIGAVAANWLMFGTSYVEVIPQNKLMIEVLKKRAKLDWKENRHVKCVVRPERVAMMPSQHHPKLLPGFTQVDASKKVFNGPFNTPVQDVDKLRIHHYYPKDEINVSVKVARRARLGLWADWKLYENVYNDVLDDTMDLFIPELRKRMQMPDKELEFDANWYVSHYRDDFEKLGIVTLDQAQRHWIEHGSKQDRCPTRSAFYALDTDFYLDFYPDLRKNGVMTHDQAINHWNTYGRFEKRRRNRWN